MFARSTILLAATVAALLLGCSAQPTGPNSVTGLVLVTEKESTWRVAGPCAPVGAFKDIAKGTDVVVRDGSGKVIGSAKLPDGAGEEDDNTDGPGSETHVCEFPFAVAGIATTKTYAVQVGDKPEQTASFEDMKARFWQLFFEFPAPSTVP